MHVKQITINGENFVSVAEAARHYNISYSSLIVRLLKGMSAEEAVALPVKKLKMGPVTVKGKTYRSFAAAAKAFNKDPEALRERLKKMTPEEALLTPNQRTNPISYKGETFPSVNAFADFYKLKRATVRSRMKRGWSLDDIISKGLQMVKIKLTYKDKEYKSLNELCVSLKLPYKLVYKRLKTFGWSLEDAIETPLKVGRTLKVGKKIFKTVRDAADYYGIDHGTLSYRLNKGWDVKKAVDPNAEVDNRTSITINRRSFKTLSSAAREYGIEETTFMKRLKSNWSPEQAAGLEEPPEIQPGVKPVPPEEYRLRLSEIHGGLLDFSKSKFGRAQDKIEVRCLENQKHPTFWATPNNLLRGKGCPICKTSHGERRVSKWLDKHKFHYEVQWTGHGLRTGVNLNAVLRMDFHLPKQKTIIEYDGAQHFEPTTMGRMSESEAEKAFENIKVNDKRKNKWAKENNYKMIRIKYSENVEQKLSKHLER